MLRGRGLMVGKEAVTRRGLVILISDCLRQRMCGNSALSTWAVELLMKGGGEL